MLYRNPTKTKVKIVEDAIEIEGDRHDLLDAVEKCWRDKVSQSPTNSDGRWKSSIPIGQGLKSSSALSCAALRALNSCAWLVFLTLRSQISLLTPN